MSDSEMEEMERECEEGIQEIDNLIIKSIFNYLRTENFTKKSTQSYILSYTIVYKLSDDEYDSSGKLFNYYNAKINEYLKEACKNIQCENENKLIDTFLKETEKSKILIHWMRKVFCYLDQFHTTNSKVGSLFENGLRNYYNNLFVPLKTQVINSLNNLINEHRDGKAVEIMKIVKVIKIFRQVDLKNPILTQVEDGYDWTGNPLKSNKGVLYEWFSNYFIPSTESYIGAKSNNEISSLSAPEYVKSCLKYLKEEEERKSLFISRDFHTTLDKVNNKHLIQEHSEILATVSLNFIYS